MFCKRSKNGRAFLFSNESLPDRCYGKDLIVELSIDCVYQGGETESWHEVAHAS